ncbi:N-acetylneuraminate synthase family protein [Saccharospirillum alexandrii]|uniref:N-acetylneuraminate synthase family protein n=1 Tax=Saccharospirillum alexandrii TaxID=2448477 RepID=UPI0037358224
MNDVFLIAEAGVNHDGVVEKAHHLVELAARCGADAVKFQTFNTDALVRQGAAQAEYQKRALANDQYSLLQQLELPAEAFKSLAQQAQALNMEFMTTAFDTASLALLDDLPVKRYKIPSGEITNLPFIIQHARRPLPIILSTGMASIRDIEQACAAVVWGRLYPDRWPLSISELMAVYEQDFPNLAKHQLTLLHCTSAYPAPVDSLNLSAITDLQSRFGVPIGYSDHSLGNSASLITMGLGVRLIEKHFTLDTSMPGPDHQASMSPEQLADWVQTVRAASRALGSASKQTHQYESDVKHVARKSLVARHPIAMGQIIQEQDLTFKRPGSGLPPSSFFDRVNQPAHRAYEADEDIE